MQMYTFYYNYENYLIDKISPIGICTIFANVNRQVTIDERLSTVIILIL